MKRLNPAELKEIALDIEVELEQLTHLRTAIERVNQLIAASPDLADLLYENQALKLHNFYTGCERVFQIVASELNGALPTGYDWHKRLLERMTLPHEGPPSPYLSPNGPIAGKIPGLSPRGAKSLRL